MKPPIQMLCLEVLFVLHAGNAGEADAGLATPLEVYQGLAADGYQVSYRRVPLSRERTPEAADLDVLHQQLMTQPVGMAPLQHLNFYASLLLRVRCESVASLFFSS